MPSGKRRSFIYKQLSIKFHLKIRFHATAQSPQRKSGVFNTKSFFNHGDTEATKLHREPSVFFSVPSVSLWLNLYFKARKFRWILLVNRVAAPLRSLREKKPEEGMIIRIDYKSLKDFCSLRFQSSREKKLKRKRLPVTPRAGSTIFISEKETDHDLMSSTAHRI